MLVIVKCVIESKHLYVLSELANRIARVTASGSPSLTSAAAFHTQLRSEPTLGDRVISGTTARKHVSVKLTSLRTRVREEHVGEQHTVVVGADLERLLSSHNQADLVVLLVLEQSDIASSSLLPLAGGGGGILAILLGGLDELEQLGAHLEELLLRLLVGLDIDLLGQLDDGLEVNVLALGGLLLYDKYLR